MEQSFMLAHKSAAAKFNSVWPESDSSQMHLGETGDINHKGDVVFPRDFLVLAEIWMVKFMMCWR